MPLEESSLCRLAFTARRLASQLLREARRSVGEDAPLYLCVLRAGLDSRCAQIAQTMGKRVGRLCDTYARLGCTRVHQTDRYILFRVA